MSTCRATTRALITACISSLTHHKDRANAAAKKAVSAFCNAPQLCHFYYPCCAVMQADISFWSSLVKYLNNVEEGADGKHNSISSFFMWAWDANADTEFGLGGMISLDYETLNWPKMAMLIDNSTEFTYGMGLKPWYMSGFILPAGISLGCSQCSQHVPARQACMMATRSHV